MGDPLKKVLPGQDLTIPAQAYNAFVEAALAHRGVKSHGVAVPERQYSRHPGLIRVRNPTAGVLARFAPVGLSGVAIDPTASLANFQNTPVFNAAAPGSSSYLGKFAACLALSGREHVRRRRRGVSVMGTRNRMSVARPCCGDAPPCTYQASDGNSWSDPFDALDPGWIVRWAFFDTFTVNGRLLCSTMGTPPNTSSDLYRTIGIVPTGLNVIAEANVYHQQYAATTGVELCLPIAVKQFSIFVVD